MKTQGIKISVKRSKNYQSVELTTELSVEENDTYETIQEAKAIELNKLTGEALATLDSWEEEKEKKEIDAVAEDISLI